MDTYYHTDEQYLQAIEELRYGEPAKAMHLLHALIESDPNYARAYYQLGCIYYYRIINHQTAGYYFKRCIALEPDFPEVYIQYLKLLITLQMYPAVEQTAKKALLVPGICETCIYETLGNYAERTHQLAQAETYYKQAIAVNIDTDAHSDLRDHLKRVAKKLDTSRKVTYIYSD